MKTDFDCRTTGKRPRNWLPRGWHVLRKNERDRGETVLIVFRYLGMWEYVRIQRKARK